MEVQALSEWFVTESLVSSLPPPPPPCPPPTAGFLSSVLKHLHKDPEEVAVTVMTVVKEKVGEADSNARICMGFLVS